MKCTVTAISFALDDRPETLNFKDGCQIIKLELSTLWKLVKALTSSICSSSSDNLFSFDKTDP
jgi:hypothetical protein